MMNNWCAPKSMEPDWSVERHVQCRSEEDYVRNYLADYIKDKNTLKGYRQTLAR